ncbi:MAG: D-alanyl-D-alanine carboxypeptidase family protein [Ruminococcus sp.]|nr:D-alanyl-D-alanine carboxypeptidase family protein [Ruminococcus sp.]
MKKGSRKLTAMLIGAAAAAASVPVGSADTASTLIKGDINRDDSVSVGDVVLLENYLLKKYGLNEQQMTAADMNSDGSVDVFDLVHLKELLLVKSNVLPKGTWIGDCLGAKRYFSFGDGDGVLTYPEGGRSRRFSIEADRDLFCLTMNDTESSISAVVTWLSDSSFVLRWEDGTAEVFRFLCDNIVSSSEFLSGHWVTSQGRTFDMDGLSGKLSDRNGNISRFEYAPDGENIVFHFGSTDNNTEGKIVHTDSMHFKITWSDGTEEVFTRQEIEKKDGITYVNGILIANKTYGLPSDYNPGKILPEAQSAFEEMQAAAKKDGITLTIVSGFRSYSYQGTLYNNYVARDGKADADTYSARPGYSEHQTGLAMDLNNASRYFNGSKEAKWIAANCWKYGFIIRYPEGKQDITGYMYESWHVRYLGKELAKEVYDSGLTLEEFLCIDSKYKS